MERGPRERNRAAPEQRHLQRAAPLWPTVSPTREAGATGERRRRAHVREASAKVVDERGRRGAVQVRLTVDGDFADQFVLLRDEAIRAPSLLDFARGVSLEVHARAAVEGVETDGFFTTKPRSTPRRSRGTW